MQEPSETELEIMAAERAVDDARDKLVAEIEAVSETGREALARVVHKARPVAIAAAAIAGVAVLAGTVALLRRSFSRRRTPLYFAPPQRSLLGEMARRALTSVASTLAAAMAQRVLVSLGEHEALPAASRANGRAPKQTSARSQRAKHAER